MEWPFKNSRRVYLDAAAGMSPNPSSPHEEGRAARAMLEDARTKIARLVEVQADDVVFVSGATEGNALAILGHAQALKRTGREKIHMLYLPTAHASIAENMKALAAWGVEVEPLALKDGRVDIEALSAMLTPHTALVSMEAVCGETGTVWNTREVKNALDAHVGRPTSYMGRKGGRPLLHVDASQAPLTQKITRAHFGADLLVLDASKISHARGIGTLIAHRTISLAPLYRGGGQERGLRPGSEAPHLARDFADALAQRVAERASFCTRSSRLRESFVRGIRSIERIHIYEAPEQAPHIVNLSLPGRDTDYLVALMDEAGIAVATRSACETDSREGSRALMALTGERERALSTLRISWGPDVAERDLARAAEALVEAVRFVDRHGILKA